VCVCMCVRVCVCMYAYERETQREINTAHIMSYIIISSFLFVLFCFVFASITSVQYTSPLCSSL